jgi:hypothetical protein
VRKQKRFVLTCFCRCFAAVVHNIKSNSQRLVKITPSSKWGGSGLLGVTIRLDNYGGADERLIRVLSVEHNSPAAIAGLTPLTDYLLGTTSASFDSDDMLAEVLYVHVDRIVEIYVYNTETDMVRVVTLMPTNSWGGRGLLGAEVGTGYLHGFPKSVRETDGKSVERKVRLGVRPTEAIAEGEHNIDDQVKSELENETAITDEVSGKTMCFAEQMEMEPEPTESHKQQRPLHQNPGGESTSERKYASEADALFSQPPPGNGASYADYSTQYAPQPVSEHVDLR